MLQERESQTATATVFRSEVSPTAIRCNKTRPRIDRERLKALLENETNDSGELIDAIERFFLPAQQPPPAQQKKELAPTDGNRQIQLTCTTKTGKIQEPVVPKTSKSGDPIRGFGNSTTLQCYL